MSASWIVNGVQSEVNDEFVFRWLMSPPRHVGTYDVRLVLQVYDLVTEDVVLPADREIYTNNSWEVKEDTLAPHVQLIWVSGLASTKSYFVTYKYTSTNEIDTEELDGSFKLVSSSDKNTELTIAAASCNTNVDLLTDKYQKPGGPTLREPGCMWDKLNQKSPDVIIHHGDQVYLDKLNSDKYRTDNVERAFQRVGWYYHSSYSAPYQGMAMRNAQNIMNIDDHDVDNGFGSPGDITSPNIAVDAAIQGIAAFQTSLRLDRDQPEDDGLSLLNKPMYFQQRLGRNMLLVFLDERWDRWLNNKEHKYVKDMSWRNFYDAQQSWFENDVNPTAGDRFIVVSSRPFGHFPLKKADELHRQINSPGGDDMWRSVCVSNTAHMLNLIANKHASPENTLIISGDAHQTYVSDIYIDNVRRGTQFVTSAITRSPRGAGLTSRIAQWFYSKDDFTDDVDGHSYRFARRPDSWTLTNNFGIVDSDLNIEQVTDGQTNTTSIAASVFFIVFFMSLVGLLIFGMFMRLFVVFPVKLFFIGSLVMAFVIALSVTLSGH
jgi:phosphodiesterase/alkaline phosphatase D-like protein